MSGLIIIPNYMPALDTNGNPIPGALIYFYLNGTNTPTTVYANAALTTPLSNPVTADSSGVFPLVYAKNGLSFTVTLTGPDGENPKTYDDVYVGIVNGGVATFSPLAFGAVGNGTISGGGADDSDAVQAAFDAAGKYGGTIHFDDGYVFRTTRDILCRATLFPSGQTTSPLEDIHFTNANTQRIQSTGNGQIIADFNGDAAITLIYNSDISAIGPFWTVIDGLRLVCATGRTITYGIFLNYTMHVDIKNVRVDGFANGIGNNGYGVFRLSHFAIRGRVGVNVTQGGDNIISHGDFYPLAGSALTHIYINLSTSSSNTTIGPKCTFNRELASGTLVAVKIDGTLDSSVGNRDVDIYGNEFSQMTTAILITGAPSTSNMKNINIWGNHLNASNAYSTGQFLYAEYAQNIKSWGNTAGLKGGSALNNSAIVQLVHCDTVKLFGETYQNSQVVAVLATDTVGLTITDCDFLDCAKTDASFTIVDLGTGVSRAVVHDNRFNQSSSSYGQNAVYERSGATLNRAWDNRFEGTVATPYTVDGSSGSTFTSGMLQDTEAPKALSAHGSAGIKGRKRIINDSLAAPVYNATAVGGGTVTASILDNGTNWVYA